MPKNIVVFADGTGQEGGKGNNTNVYKMFNMIEDRTPGQIAFYDPGVGTNWHKITGNISGMGISRNIRQCYRFIFENYQAGDKIFLMGFSRGAATVRSLSGFIHYFGILPLSRPELIKQAYKIYKINNREKRAKKAQAFIGRHHTMWTRIHFLGCYDTVAALGLPFKTASAILDGLPGFRHRFHDFRLSESVENAFQALAIDDERKTFHPVLWDSPVKDYQTMRQVWFCGMHTDVGGGYKEQGISDIALGWLTQRAVDHGLRLYAQHKVEVNEDCHDKMHDSRKGFPGIIYRRKRRFWPAGRPDKPVVHQSVIERHEDVNLKYDSWILKLDYELEVWRPFGQANRQEVPD